MSYDKSKHEVLSDILNAYKNHPSINQLENKVNMQNFFGKFFSLSLLLHRKLKNLSNALIQIKPPE